MLAVGASSSISAIILSGGHSFFLLVTVHSPSSLIPSRVKDLDTLLFQPQQSVKITQLATQNTLRIEFSLWIGPDPIHATIGLMSKVKSATFLGGQKKLFGRARKVGEEEVGKSGEIFSPGVQFG